MPTQAGNGRKSDVRLKVVGPEPVVFELPDVQQPHQTTYLISGWTFYPPDVSSPASLVVCFHGGGYTSSYFHPEVPGRPGYSMAEHFAMLGHIVVAVDQLGVGASTTPSDGSLVTVDLVAAAQHHVSQQIAERASSGTLAPGLGPLPVLTTTGIGHSIGGATLAVQQARRRSFDRAALLGCTLLPRQWGGEFAFQVESGYAHFDRMALGHGFYWDDVPAEVVKADEGGAVAMPVGIVDAPDVAAAEASLIDVPLFLSFGERDVSPSPHREVGLYTRSSDVTLHLLRRSGHCTNFASGRQRLWDRLSGWIREVGR